MRLTVFGSGYVGLVAGACFAEAGNDVICVDTDSERIQSLRAGQVPIHEPGLAELISQNQAAGRLRFMVDVADAVSHGEVIFIAVGTPQAEDGSADLRHVLAVARTIGQHLDADRVIVIKSTVPVGTTDRVEETVEAELAARGVERTISVVSNPEFLREGGAVTDFMKPDRIIVGTRCARAIEVLRLLYRPFGRSQEKLLVMDVRSAELTKYAANAMLATRISFMNEIANLAERVGADIENVRLGIGADSRIGYSYIYPGAGYGGSCFPKDVRALIRTAEDAGQEPHIIRATEAVNAAQKRRMFEKVSAHYEGRLGDRVIAVWGLAFKPDTDDTREAPSLDLIDGLLDAGAQVRAYDPEAGERAREVFAGRDGLSIIDKPMLAVEGSDALVVMTEWKEFRSPDLARLSELLRDKLIFDGRNIYDPERLEAMGITYYGIGRGRT